MKLNRMWNRLKKLFQPVRSVQINDVDEGSKEKSVPLTVKSSLPKKTTTVNGIPIWFFRFEGDVKILREPDKFNLFVFLTMGPAQVGISSPPVEIDVATLLVKIGLAANKKQAKRLMKRGAIGIGEPANGIRPLKDGKIKIDEPSHALLTINRSLSDWVFVAFEE